MYCALEWSQGFHISRALAHSKSMAALAPTRRNCAQAQAHAHAHAYAQTQLVVSRSPHVRFTVTSGRFTVASQRK